MMEFIVMTLSITVAILLASGLAVIIMLNKKVMNWYLNKVYKATFTTFESLEGKIEEL